MSLSSTSLTLGDLGGNLRVFMRFPDPEDTRWSAFNPSIAYAPDGTLGCIIRSSNYIIRDDNGVTTLQFGKFIRTRAWFCVIDPETRNPSHLREVRFLNPLGLPYERGVEDARLFWRDGSWYFTAVIWEPPTIKYARQVLYRYDVETSVATFQKILEAPREDRSEKNWMVPDQPTPAFDFNYSPTQTYKDGKVVGDPIDMEASIRKDRYLSSIRGGSQLILQDDGTYLACVHDVFVRVVRRYNPDIFGIEVAHYREYQHYFARYSSEGLLTHLSNPFIFKRVGIEFAAGMVEYKNDLLISFGAKDIFSGLAVIPKETAISLLKPISS